MLKRLVLTALAALLLAAAPASAAPSVESWECGGGYNSGSFDAAHRLYVPCGSPSRIHVYAADGTLERTVALPFFVSDVAPSPDGAHLYVTSAVDDAAPAEPHRRRRVRPRRGLAPGELPVRRGARSRAARSSTPTTSATSTSRTARGSTPARTPS